MRFVLAALIPFVLSIAWTINGRAQSVYDQTADIEFLEAPHFIQTILQDDGPVLKMSFRLTTNDHQRSVPIGTCVYEESALKKEVVGIQDPSVRAAFREWIFLRDDRSPVTLDHFYPFLKSLLERTSPSCPVPTLEELLKQLRTQRG